eukprot:Trichotokara_eunicae@DN3724_c0_g1_i2.p1
MGKNRGFKPQGTPNPIAASRLIRSRPVEVSLDIINKADRPSWDEYKKNIEKNQKKTNDFLEVWENENFAEELEKDREKRFKEQEKKDAKRRKEEKKKRKEEKKKRKESPNPLQLSQFMKRK